MNLNKARSHFPITSTDHIYLNHAAISPYNTVHEKAMNEYYQARSFEDVEYYPSLIEDSVHLKTSLGQLINGKPEQIAFVQNTIEGLQLLVDHLEWNSGQEIVIYRKDFPSNVYPFLNLEKMGVKVNIVEDDNFIFNDDAYVEMINENTRLVTVSYVQFLTGQVADLEKISKRCHEVGALFVVDSIQGVGAIRLDVEKLKIDYISNGGHKWMMFPMGMGFMYYSDRLKNEFNRHRAGWLNKENPFDLFNWENPNLDDSRRFNFGSFPLLNIKIAKEIMTFRKDIGEDQIEKQVLALSSHTRQKLIAFGLDLLDHPDANFSSGIISFRHDSQSLLEELKKKDVTIAEREGIYRIAPHFYNTIEEIDEFCDRLKPLL